MDTSLIIQTVIAGVVSGLVLLILQALFTPTRAAVGAIYQRLASWVRQLVSWASQLVSWAREFLFVKPHCTIKRRLFAMCDVSLEDLNMVGVDTSKYQPQLGDRKCIESGMTFTVAAKDVKKISQLNGSISMSVDDFNIAGIDLIDKEYSFPDQEYEVPCFVDDIHPLAKSMKQFIALKK